VQPAHGINFGPIPSCTLKSKSFEIVNTGTYDFVYVVCSDVDGEFHMSNMKYGSSPSPFPDPSENQNVKKQVGQSKGLETLKKSADNIKKQNFSGSSITTPTIPVDEKLSRVNIGPFLIKSATGLIQPGQSSIVSVDFAWETTKTFSENIRIVVSGSNPEEFSKGMIFELGGEVCIPGIDIHNFDSIFEEQKVLPKIDLYNLEQSTFFLYEKIFMFGSTIIGKISEQKFKLTNPHKIPCDVFMDVLSKQPLQNIGSKTGVLPKTLSSKSQTTATITTVSIQSSIETLGFDIQPRKFSIPPKENAIVTVSFLPNLIKKYEALFQVFVQSSSTPLSTLLPQIIPPTGTSKPTSLQAKSLVVAKDITTLIPQDSMSKIPSLCFELQGFGTIPHIIIVDPQPFTLQEEDLKKKPASSTPVPKAANPKSQSIQPQKNVLIPDNSDVGKFILKFSKTLVGRNIIKTFTIRNDSDIPTSARIELPETEHYYVSIDNPDLLSLANQTVSDGSRKSKPFLSFDLEKNESVKLQVKFQPREIGQHSDKIRIYAVSNEYDDVFLHLRGECYTSNIIFDNIPPLSQNITVQSLSSLLESTVLQCCESTLAQKNNVASQSISQEKSVGAKVGIDILFSYIKFLNKAINKPISLTPTQQQQAVEKMVAETLASFQIGDNTLQVVSNVTEILSFGDMFVGESKEFLFTIQNKTDKIYRFNWNPVGSQGTQTGLYKPPPSPPVEIISPPLINSKSPPTATTSKTLAPNPKTTVLNTKTLTLSKQHETDSHSQLPKLNEDDIKKVYIPSQDEYKSCFMDFYMKPTVGHLHPFSSKQISISFTPSFPKSVVYPLGLNLTEIKYPDGVLAECKKEGKDYPDWDDSKLIVKFVLPNENKSTTTLHQGEGGKSKLVQVSEIIEEPEYTILTPSRPISANQNVAKPQNANLKVTNVVIAPVINYIPPVFLLLHAICNFSQYRIDSNDIKFQETLMFQKRSFTFPLHNIGTVALPFKAFIHFPLTSSEISLNNQINNMVNRYYENSSEIFLEDSNTPSNTEQPLVNPPGALDTDSLKPFTITPSEGVVLPDQKVDLDIIFKPFNAENFQRELWFLFPHRLRSLPPPRILISGNAIRPICHFEFDSSDYLENRRTDDLIAQYPVVLGTKVIEIESRGVNIRNVKRFYVLNPTNMAWTFKIDCIEQYRMSSSVENQNNVVYTNQKKPFTCQTPNGTVMPGLKCEIVFEFTPLSLDVVESTFIFRISSTSQTQPLLLVGTTFEPSLYLSPHHINFGSRLLNNLVEETLKIVNSETEPFSFSFDDTVFRDDNQRLNIENTRVNIKSSNSSDSGKLNTKNINNINSKNPSKSLITILPLSGVVRGKSELEIKLQFNPFEEKYYNFNVPCTIQNKTQKLNLNIKGEGYVIREIFEFISEKQLSSSNSVSLIPSKGKNFHSLSEESTVRKENASQVNPFGISFGSIQIKEISIKKFSLTNIGSYPLEFNCSLLRFFSKIQTF
jgi:hypothetical protein